MFHNDFISAYYFILPATACPSNCRLTCVCGFADAKRKAKLARKLHKKGSAGDRPSNFRDKTNVSVEAGVRCFHLFYWLLKLHVS